jgi:hypothetical protein
MTHTRGRVVDGKIAIDDYPLVEGSILTITIHDDMESQVLTSEMEAELNEAIAELDSGEYVTWDELRPRLKEIERRARSE